MTGDGHYHGREPNNARWHHHPVRSVSADRRPDCTSSPASALCQKSTWRIAADARARAPGATSLAASVVRAAATGGDYGLVGALKWPFWDKMSHFVQTFAWRNGWVSGLLGHRWLPYEVSSGAPKVRTALSS